MHVSIGPARTRKLAHFFHHSVACLVGMRTGFNPGVVGADRVCGLKLWVIVLAASVVENTTDKHPAGSTVVILLPVETKTQLLEARSQIPFAGGGARNPKLLSARYSRRALRCSPLHPAFVNIRGGAAYVDKPRCVALHCSFGE